MPWKTRHLGRSEDKAPLSFTAHLMNGLCPQVPVKYCFPTTPPEVTPSGFTGEEEHGPGHSETQESASEKGHAQALLLRLQGRSL